MTADRRAHEGGGPQATLHCTEPADGRRTFVEVSDQVPLRGRASTRLRAAVLDAVVGAGRVVGEVAAAHGVSWGTVQKAVNAAANVLPNPDEVPVMRLGVDDGCCASSCRWVSVDAFHLVKLTSDALTQIRQRVTREAKGRRGRGIGPSWVNRRLLRRAGDPPRPDSATGHPGQCPTEEIDAACGFKEQLRRVLAGTGLADAEHQRMLLATYILGADTPETDRLWRTLNAWWPAIEVLIITGVTNARTAAAQHQHQAHQAHRPRHRNPAHHKARIVLLNAARSAA